MILVTGGAGFIGSNIATALAERGEQVAVCDRLRQGDKWRNLARVPLRDFIDPQSLLPWLQNHVDGIEAIVHMGAITSTTESDADLITAVNFRLPLTLWRWCATFGKRFIYASSASTYGDGVGDVNLPASIDYHRRNGRILTLTGVRPPGRWGELQVHDGAVTTFYEKPQAFGGRINGGFFVANRKLFDYLDDDPALVFEQRPLTQLSNDGQLGCYAHDGFWQPMDTYQEFMLLNRLWDEGRAPWKMW